ncbi:MAG: PQQ-binding-like beta-propeller repeat protein [Phototrophicaceae bacterium]
MPETMQLHGNPGDQQPSGVLSANTVLLRRYKVMGVLGGGGMGTVYQARDLNFPDVRRLAAVKEMHTPSGDRALRDQMLATFRREANILATLNHPAIPKIYDFFDQNDRVYLVMEHINGRDLEALLSQTKTLPIEKVIEWSIDLCEVLSYLHNHQPDSIIFRDMKPSNIMIDNLGKVRLIDFGIAKTFVGANKQTIIGTEGYSGPEQYKGNASPRSDQYSLGATLHHILTRKDPRLEPPFSFPERPIRNFNADVPAWFVEVVDKALAFNAEDRFESCEAMAEAIRQRQRRQYAAVAAPEIAPAAATGTSFIEAGGEIEPKWVFKTEDEIRSSPLVYEGKVYIGSYDTNMWCLNLENGQQVWKFSTLAGIASSPVVDTTSKLILFGSEDSTFNAVNPLTGRVIWSFATKDKIRSSPVVANNYIFFGSDDGRLYTLSASNGRKLWDFDAGSPVRNRVLVTDEILIFGNGQGEILGVTLAGERKWVYRTKRDIKSSACFDEREGICYIGSDDGFLYAIDITSGYNSWRFRTNGPIISSPVIWNDFIIFGSVDGNVYSVDTYGQKEKWRFPMGKPVLSSPIIYENNVYIGGTDHYLYCLDAKTGKEKWKFKAHGEILSTPTIASVGNTPLVIFGSLDYHIYAVPILE